MSLERGAQAKIKITARNLSVGYGDFVALEIPRLLLEGRMISVIGHNGSGKSTFIKALLRLLTPKNGHLHTRWIAEGKRELLIPERDMAFSPEHGSVFADISVENYIKLWCRIKHRDASYYQKAGSYYIEGLNIAPLFKKLGRELSKGQKRRVQTAIGFITNPRLFLFDEPFDGLDVQQSSHLAEIMREESSKMAMFISSHRMDVVERLTDELIVLENGRVVTHGSVPDVCQELCSNSVLISNGDGSSTHVQELMSIVRREFSECLVNRIGSQVSITGKDFDTGHLSAFFKANNLNGIKLRSTRPSLVDAMNYYLRNEK